MDFRNYETNIDLGAIFVDHFRLFRDARQGQNRKEGLRDKFENLALKVILKIFGIFH